MMKRKIWPVMAFCLFWGLIACTASLAADRVGYIDLQRLVNESKAGKAARADIQKLRKEKETIIADLSARITKLKGLIDEKGTTMAPREKRQQVDELQKLYKEYQRLVADARDDITREDRELVSIILEKADSVLKKVAQKGKYAVILKDPKAIGYLDPSIDITDKVLKELNR